MTGTRPSPATVHAGLEPELLAEALETLPVGVTIADCSGKILYVNPAEAEMHGYRQDELIGRDAGELAPSSARRPLSPGQLGELTSWRRESVNRRKDGEHFPVELISDAIRDENGDPVAVVTTCRDISEEKRAEREKTESRQRFELVVRGSSEGVWDWNLATGEVYFSPLFLVTIGLDPDSAELQLETWLNAVHPEDAPGLRDEIARYLARDVVRFEHEHRVQRPDGSYRWMRTRAVALWHQDGTPLRIVGSLVDVTDLKARDGLTKLPNRASLLERLGHVMALSQRRPIPSFALLFIDVDRFKVVNDSLGHLIGDQLLEQLSRRLLSCLRGSDTLARYGGDEFAVLVEDIGSVRDALVVSDRIHAKLRDPFEIAGKNLYITVSIGIAFHRPEKERPEDLVRDADLAMYRAKAVGRGRHQVFEESLRAEAESLLEIETDLRAALEDDSQLVVEYQPIYDLESSTLYGLEALVRWDHPKRGAIAPSQFLPVAEDTGMIVEIGTRVLDQACAQMSRWVTRDGLAELFLTVNLSTRQLRDEGLAEQVRRALERHALEPSRLLFEIAETSLLEQTDTVLSRIESLRELGVRVALDDFGTGYSSLRYLQQYPIDIIKIDRSFIQQLGPHGEGAELVSILLGLGSDLDIGVIAEGIEAEEQLASLRNLECRLGQGYQLSRPIRAAGIDELLDKGGALAGQPPGAAKA